MVLRDSDDRRGLDRIKQTAWLNKLPLAVQVRSETLYLLKEAVQVFIDGYFAAAFLLCLSVIHHCLVEELQWRGEIKGDDPGFKATLNTCKKIGILQNDLYDTLCLLVERRHPFVHFRNPKDEHSLGARVISKKVPPEQLMEEDAKSAMTCMSQVFQATVHEWDGKVGTMPDAILFRF